MARSWLRHATVLECMAMAPSRFEHRSELVASPWQTSRPFNRHTLGILELRCGGKKLRFFSQLDDFHEFVDRLRKANPAIEVYGR